MSIPYIVRKKADSSKGERKELWYAVSKKLQKRGGKTEKDLAHMVEQRTGFHHGTVEGVIAAMAEVIEEMLSEGHSVTIKDFGSFQTAVTSKGFEHPEDVTPGEVSVSRMYFVANRKLTRRLKEEQCHRIPFQYYFPKEQLTKKLLQEDKRQEKQEDEI